MGKGSAPRNIFSPEFRKNYDEIFGKRGKTCPHGKSIGDECPECAKLAKPSYVGANWKNRKTSV